MSSRIADIPGIVDTRLGRYLLISRNDIISRVLFCNGLFEPTAYSLYSALFDNSATAIDVGANMGTFAVSAGLFSSSGMVFAYEAQRIIFLQLSANVILNGLTNVFTYNYAVGNPLADNMSIEVPIINYADDTNIGAVSLNKNVMSNNTVFIRNGAIKQYSSVDLVSLDRLHANHNIDFIKIDVEGMEYDVLEGAKNLIQRCNPVIFFEAADYVGTEKSGRDWFADKPYQLYQIGYDILAFPLKGIRTRKIIVQNEDRLEIIPT